MFLEKGNYKTRGQPKIRYLAVTIHSTLSTVQFRLSMWYCSGDCEGHSTSTIR